MFSNNLKTMTLVATVVIMFGIGAQMPIINIITTVIAAGIISALAIGFNIYVSLACTVAGFFAAMFLSGSVETAVTSVLSVLAISLPIYFFVKRGVNFKPIMVFTILSSFICIVAIAVYTAWRTTGVITVDSIMSPVDLIFSSYYNQLVSSGVATGYAQQMIDQLKVNIRNLFIGYIACSAVLMSFFSFILSKYILDRVYERDMSGLKFFETFKMSREGGIIFLVIFVMSTMIKSGMISAVFYNFVLIFTPIFLLNGLSVTEYYMRKFRIRKFQRGVFYFVSVLTVISPVFNMINIIVILGMFDAIINYRKLPI